MKHVAIYLRVSSRKQDTQSQQPDPKRWAHAQANGTPLRWYRDKWNGTTMGRPGWNRLQRAIGQGRVGRASDRRVTVEDYQNAVRTTTKACPEGLCGTCCVVGPPALRFGWVQQVDIRQILRTTGGTLIREKLRASDDWNGQPIHFEGNQQTHVQEKLAPHSPDVRHSGWRGGRRWPPRETDFYNRLLHHLRGGLG